MRLALILVGLSILLFPLPTLAEEDEGFFIFPPFAPPPEPIPADQPPTCNIVMVQGLQQISRGLLFSEARLLLESAEQNNSSHYDLWAPYTALQMRHSCLRNAFCHSVERAVLEGSSPDGATLPISLNAFGGVAPGPFAYCVTRSDLEVDEYTPPKFSDLWSAEALHPAAHIPEGFFSACTRVGNAFTNLRTRQNLSNICDLHAERETGIFTETLFNLLATQTSAQVTDAFYAQSIVIGTNLGKAQVSFVQAMNKINNTLGNICQIPQ